MLESYQKPLLALALKESLYFLQATLKQNVELHDEGYYSPESAQTPLDVNHRGSNEILRLQTTISSLEYFLQLLPVIPRSLRQPVPPNLHRDAVLSPTTSNVLLRIDTVITRCALPSAVIKCIISSIPKQHSDHIQDQHTLYLCALVNSDWNEIVNEFLWMDPCMISKKQLSQLVFSAKISGIRLHQQCPQPSGSPTKYAWSAAPIKGENRLSYYTQRLDLSATQINDTADSKLIAMLATSFPYLTTLKWGGNPIHESTLCDFFHHCPGLRHLSITGPILTSATRGSPNDIQAHLHILQTGLSKIVTLELLDYENEISLSSATLDSSSWMTRPLSAGLARPPTTIDVILRTIPKSNQLGSFVKLGDGDLTGSKQSLAITGSKHNLSLSTADLSTGNAATTGIVSMKSLSATQSKSLKKMADLQLQKIRVDTGFLATAASPSSQPTSNLSHNRSELPQILHKAMTGSLNHLSLTGTSTMNVLINIARRATGLTRVILSNCVDLNDRAAIILAANCGASLRTISFHGCGDISDESVNEIATYCPNLEFLDLCNTSVTDISLTALAHNIQEYDHACGRNNRRFSRAVPDRKFLRGLYLDKTRTLRDGGSAMMEFIVRGGSMLRDLSIKSCCPIDDDLAIPLFHKLSTHAPLLERIDARNTISPACKPAEHVILSLGCRLPNLNTLNVGGLGLEYTEFMLELSKIYPREGCALFVPEW